MHCTAALHCTSLQCNKHVLWLHCTEYCTALQCTALPWEEQHYTALLCNTLHCTLLHCTAISCTAGLIPIWLLAPPPRCSMIDSVSQMDSINLSHTQSTQVQLIECSPCSSLSTVHSMQYTQYSALMCSTTDVQYNAYSIQQGLSSWETSSSESKVAKKVYQ